MENYSLEIPTKNIIQSNIERIKRSMKKLKDTINRSNSNNYKNITTHPHNYYKNKNIKEENKSEIYYNIKDLLFLNNNIINSPRNGNVNLKKNNFHKSTSIYNNKTENNLIKKKIDKSYYDFNSFNYNYTHNNENKNDYIYNSFIPSRNKYNIDNNNKTELYLNNELDNNILNKHKLTDFSSNIHHMNTNNYNNNNLHINRYKSEKQIKPIYNLINKNYYNNLNDNEYSISNINTLELNNNDKNNNYENYLKNQIKIYDNINKGLLIRYKNIINNFKSSNERNNLLLNKINKLKIEEKKLKYTNIMIEKELNSIKNNISENNNNKELIIKKNEDSKYKIYKYDEIILSLKNEINKLIEKHQIKQDDFQKEINYDNIKFEINQ